MKYKYCLHILLLAIILNGCKTSDIQVLTEDPTEESPSVTEVLTEESSTTPKITILKKITIDNLEILNEASDLAYNDEIEILYIVGDKGDLYTYDVNMENDTLALEYQNSYKIHHSSESFTIDSEGLTTNDKNELILSFEGIPRISNLSIEGKIDTNYTLPDKLQTPTNYSTNNKMLEAVAWHQDYGILTASEFPLDGQDTTKQTIYALNGNVWHFKAESYKDNAVTAIEVMEDDNLLILERAYEEGSIPAFYITLKKLYIDDCDQNNLCRTEVLYFEHMYITNYEGLTKIDKNRYLMVSDNQNQNLIATDFIYFEVH